MITSCLTLFYSNLLHVGNGAVPKFQIFSRHISILQRRNNFLLVIENFFKIIRNAYKASRRLYPEKVLLKEELAKLKLTAQDPDCDETALKDKVTCLLEKMKCS